MKKKVCKKRSGRTFLWIFLVLVFTIGISMFAANKTTITGEVISKGGHSCSIDGYGTYDSCVWNSFNPVEVKITDVPWLMKSFNGLFGTVMDYGGGSWATPQVKAWSDIAQKSTDKLYEWAPEALKDLSWCCTKDDGSAEIMVACNILDVYDSWTWYGWKWVDYECIWFWADSSKRWHQYADGKNGFYYKPSGEISS